MSADRPTAPAPNTATRSPLRGFSTSVAAHTPVCTPQPRGASTVAGTSSGAGVTARAAAAT